MGGVGENAPGDPTWGRNYCSDDAKSVLLGFPLHFFPKCWPQIDNLVLRQLQSLAIHK